MKYKTETGLLIKLCIVITSLACLVIGFNVLNSDEVLAPALALIVMAGTTYTIIQLIKRTYYLIEDGILKIRSPFYNTDIAVKDISAIHASHSWIASPAASLDRLNIKHKNGNVLISPEYRNQFLQELKTINSNIIIKL